MDDRELLELAAKAVGYSQTAPAREGGGIFVGVPYMRGMRLWNPLEDDADALRLAVRLELQLNIGTQATFANSKNDGVADKWAREQHEDSNPAAATRRAIVRAAAEIGKAMP